VCVFGKVNVKCTLLQALRLCTGRTAHRGSRGIVLLFLDHVTKRGVGSASRTGRTLPPGKTLYPLYRMLGGPQGRSGQVRKISPPPGFDLWTVQTVASVFGSAGRKLSSRMYVRWHLQIPACTYFGSSVKYVCDLGVWVSLWPVIRRNVSEWLRKLP